MGYRPYIRMKDKDEPSYYGTKLYGYLEDDCALPSCQYLISLGKWEDDPFFFDGIDNRIELDT